MAIRERGLNISNVFSGTFIPEDEVKKRRLSIPNEVLLKVQRECVKIDDEPRWLIGLISDTGMRLSEACGLHSSDIHLDSETPHIKLVEHPWRRLKTTSSRREVPLVGEALWAAKRVIYTGQEFAFPKYCNRKKCNSNSASAALKKWLKPRVPKGVSYILFDTACWAIECPADILDAIGG